MKMKLRRLMVWIAAALVLSGCVATRYVWSPDGKWMTVIGEDGLQLADADGHLFTKAIPDVTVAAWFADSKRLLVDRQISVKLWSEMTKYLTPQQTQDAIEAGQFVHAAAMAYKWNSADPKDMENFLDSVRAQCADRQPLGRNIDEMGGEILLYLRDHFDAELKQKLPPQEWADLQQGGATVQSVDAYNVDANGLTPAQHLMYSLRGIRELRLSPTSAAAIVVTESEHKNACDLWVASTEGSTPAVKLSDLSSWYPDWSPDGRDVIFMRAAQPDGGDAGLGSLSRVRVTGDDGKLLTKPGDAEDMVGLLFHELGRVRCAKDGPIIFATVELHLPTTTNDMPQRPQLFSFTPGVTPMVTRVLPKLAFDSIGDGAHYFELSPDGTHASIPDSSGTVSIVDLHTGAVDQIQPKPVLSQGKTKLITVPEWRSNDELTLMSPGDDGHPVVTLWSITKKTGTPLSAHWPAGMTEDDSSSVIEPTTKPAK
jgi:hypothetical protein